MGGKASRIFVSYRRQDSPGFAGRIADHLERHFGHDAVFRDVEAIEYGSDFVEVIDTALVSCATLVVVIGPSWLHITDAEGRERLHAEEDFVRLEVGKALARGVRVIPVLVQGAQPPSATELPRELKPLARRQSIAIDDERFGDDMLRLIRAIEPDLNSLSPRTISTRRSQVGQASGAARGRLALWVAIGALALGATGFLSFRLGGSRGEVIPPASAMRDPPAAQAMPPAADPASAEPKAPSGTDASPAVPPRPTRPKARSKPVEPRPPVNTVGPSGIPVAPAAQPAAARPRAPAPDAWTPLAMPGGTVFSIFNSAARERRAIMLRHGPPYRSIAAARRALDQGIITRTTYDDTVWTLEYWYNHEVDAAKRQYRASQWSEAQYQSRLASLKASYRGQ